MTNSEKKKKNNEVIEVWEGLKERIIILLSDLDSVKSNQEAVIERYEKKIKEKNELITKLEQKDFERDSNDTSALFYQTVLKEVSLMTRTPVNVSSEQLLGILKNLRKDYRKLRGFDDGGS